METKKCIICGKGIIKRTEESSKYWETKKYCSGKCYGQDKKGKSQWQNRKDGNFKRHSDLMIKCKCGCGELISKYASSGIIRKFRQGHQNERHRGIKRPEESKHKLELIRTGKWHPPVMSGKDHPRYTDGKQCGRSTKRAMEWKRKVFERDNHTCQDCGSKPKSRNKIAHHIKDFHEYTKLRYIVKNGKTICRSCHIKLKPPHLSRKVIL